MAKKTKTATAPASAFRKLKPAELSAMGLSPKSERYFLIASKRPSIASTISKREFTKKKFGAGPEQLVRARAEGERLYKSAETRTAAEKQRETRARKPLSEKRLSQELRRAERQAVKSEFAEARPGAGKKGGRYQLSASARGAIPDLMRRKLAGEWIDDGDWHMLADWAYAHKSPMLSRILLS